MKNVINNKTKILSLILILFLVIGSLGILNILNYSDNSQKDEYSKTNINQFPNSDNSDQNTHLEQTAKSTSKNDNVLSSKGKITSINSLTASKVFSLISLSIYLLK